jgi:hypothetical protein
MRSYLAGRLMRLPAQRNQRPIQLQAQVKVLLESNDVYCVTSLLPLSKVFSENQGSVVNC